MKLKNLMVAVLLIFITSCSAPGIQPPKSNYGFSGEEFYLSDTDALLNVVEVNNKNIKKYVDDSKVYTISPGDELNVTIWGLPEAFPNASINVKDNPLTTRTVNNDGNIFFPYVGVIKVSGSSLPELRELLTKKLSEKFVDPQVDVTVVGFNRNRVIYVVGEILTPSQLTIGLEPLSLMDALGRSKGLNPATSNPKSIYVIRSVEDDPQIYKFDISTSDKLLIAHSFMLEPKDVIYVGPSNITNWNRIISQIFPFSSFLNQLDLISNRNG